MMKEEMAFGKDIEARLEVLDKQLDLMKVEIQEYVEMIKKRSGELK